MQRAVPEARVTDEQPEMAAPFEVKLTVPVGAGDPDAVTVAVNVTDCPWVEGFWLEVTVVVAGGSVTVTVTLPLEGRSLAPSPGNEATMVLLPKTSELADTPLRVAIVGEQV